MDYMNASVLGTLPCHCTVAGAEGRAGVGHRHLLRCTIDCRELTNSDLDLISFELDLINCDLDLINCDFDQVNVYWNIWREVLMHLTLGG